MTTRRDFVRWLGVALGSSGAALRPRPADPAQIPSRKENSMPNTGADVGSLFPFIRSQAVKGEFPLSFLRSEFHEPAEWKRQAKGRVLELLHYAPPKCDARPEVLER